MGPADIVDSVVLRLRVVSKVVRQLHCQRKGSRLIAAILDSAARFAGVRGVGGEALDHQEMRSLSRDKGSMTKSGRGNKAPLVSVTKGLGGEIVGWGARAGSSRRRKAEKFIPTTIGETFVPAIRDTV